MEVFLQLGTKVSIWLADIFGFKEFAAAQRAAAVIVNDKLNADSEQYQKARSRISITGYIIIAAVLFAIYKFYKLIFLQK